MLDPLYILLHVSLLIPAIRENPRTFCQTLGITHEKYRGTLKKLSDGGFVALEDGKEKVVQVLKSKIHFGPDHPLSRAHQNHLRSFMQAELLKLPEDAKTSLMFTFTADQKSQTTIRHKVETLLKEIQREIISSKDEHVYQISFDFFRWL